MTAALPTNVGVFEWQRALSRLPKKGTALTSGVLAVALSLSLFADYPTGRNAHPSRAALALAANVSKRAVSDALATLEAGGWIEQTSTLHSGVKVWRLSIPAAVPLVFPEVAAAAGIRALEAPPAKPSGGEGNDTRARTEQHQGVKQTTAGGEGNSTRTSALTSTPTSPDTSATLASADPWEGVVVARGPHAGESRPAVASPESEQVDNGDPWEGIQVTGAALSEPVSDSGRLPLSRRAKVRSGGRRYGRTD